MKRFVRNTVSLLLAAIVLIATSGFTVFHHSCQTTQTSELSIIIPDFSCDHFQNPVEKAVHSCCSTTEPPENNSCGADNCCDTEAYLVKLDITFKAIDFNKKVVFTTLIQHIKTTYKIEDPGAEFTHIIVSNNLSPPKAGKDLHIFLHQLNIPSPTV